MWHAQWEGVLNEEGEAADEACRGVRRGKRVGRHGALPQQFPISRHRVRRSSLKRTFRSLGEVDVSVTKGATGVVVDADADGANDTCLRESSVQEVVVDVAIGGQIE